MGNHYCIYYSTKEKEMNPPRFRGNDSSKRTPFLEIRRVQHCISSGLNRNLKPELETGTSYIPSGKLWLPSSVIKGDLKYPCKIDLDKIIINIETLQMHRPYLHWGWHSPKSRSSVFASPGETVAAKHGRGFTRENTVAGASQFGYGWCLTDITKVYGNQNRT